MNHILPALLLLAGVLSAQLPSHFVVRDDGPPGVSRLGAVADFNGDGREDLLLVVDDQLTLLRSDGTGQFIRSSLGPFPRAVELVAGDVDGDGDLDAYGVSEQFLSATPWLLVRNDGAGQLSLEPIAAPPTPVNRAMLVDLDGDGDLDVVHGGGGGLKPFANDGTGSFASAPGLLPSTSFTGVGLLAADMNLDGRVDFLNPSSLAFYLLSGPNGYAPANPPPGLNSVTRGVAGDFNGDGFPDLAMLSSNSIWTWQGDGSGMLVNGGITSSGPLNEIVASDFDEDGDLDLIATPTNSALTPPLVLWANDGVGGFIDESSARLNVGNGLGTRPHPGDFDGDGDIDVFVTASQGGSIPGQDLVFVNRHVHVEVVGAVATGGNLTIQCASRPGYLTGLDVGLLVAGAEAVMPLPTLFGEVHVDPVGAVSLPFQSLPGPIGLSEFNVPVPGDPSLAGLQFALQGLLVSLAGPAPPRLTGFVRFTVN